MEEDNEDVDGKSMDELWAEAFAEQSEIDAYVAEKMPSNQSGQKVYHTSKKQDYQTPPELIGSLKARGMDFILDLAAVKETAVCQDYLGPDHEYELLRDALTLKWHYAMKGADEGAMLWLNPPYKGVDKWVKKALEETGLGARIVMLLPVRSSNDWFHRLMEKAEAIFWFNGRVKFVGQKNVAPFPSVLAVLTERGLKTRTIHGWICSKTYALGGFNEGMP